MRLLRKAMLAAAAGFALQAFGASLSPPDPTLAAVSPFYVALPDTVAGMPGSLVRAEPMAGGPAGATAWRVLYRSTGVFGEPIVTSGIVVIPSGPVPSGGRPIVAWAHPTSGVVPRCAPSNAHFWYDGVQGLRPMLRRGFIVAATDYAGLGTAGPHPYLVGASEGHAVLDAVRAARTLPGSGAGRRFTLWGHSQGGQAALFAADIAASDAPELVLAGVAVAAPATDLQTLLRDDAGSDGGRNLTAMTLWSWSRVYGLSTTHLVDARARPAMNALAEECIETVVDIAERQISQRPLREYFLQDPDVARIEPWQTLLRQNIPDPLPRGVAAFVAQGDADALVRPSVTRAYAADLCTRGNAVRYLPLPGVGHGFAGRDSADAAVAWMAARFAGAPTEDDCDAIIAPAVAAE